MKLSPFHTKDINDYPNMPGHASEAEDLLMVTFSSFYLCIATAIVPNSYVTHFCFAR